MKYERIVPPSSVDRAEPIPILTRSELVAHFIPGSGPRLVVAFAGVGTSAVGVPPYEFIGSASDGGASHVLLVSDPQRCWMNSPAYAEDLANQVARAQTRLGAEEVVAMGNSMGGFMAIRLAELIPVKTVLAIAPQYSVHPEIVPEEQRWNRHRAKISTWIVRDVGALKAKDTRYFVFHGDALNEHHHWRRFPEGPHIHHYILQGEDHRLGRALRRKRLLKPIVRKVWLQRPKAVRLVLENRAGGAFKPVYRNAYPSAAGSDADVATKLQSG